MARRPKITEESKKGIESVLEVLTGDVQTRLANKGGMSFPKYGFARKTSEKKPCTWAFPKPWPGHRVEFEVVTDKKAAALNITPGPAIRLCFAKDTAGPLIRVGSIDEATRIGNDFLNCVEPKKGRGKAAKTCATIHAKGTSHVIAGLRSRRRSRR